MGENDWTVFPWNVKAAKGAKGQKHSDTTPALLYAKLTTRLFLKVNLHLPGARLREEAACRYLLAQSRQINIPFYSWEISSTARRVLASRAPQTRRNNSGLVDVRTEMATSRLRISECIRLFAARSFTHEGMRLSYYEKCCCRIDYTRIWNYYSWRWRVWLAGKQINLVTRLRIDKDIVKWTGSTLNLHLILSIRLFLIWLL